MKNLVLVLVLILFVVSGYSRSAYEVVGNDVVINLDAYGIKSNLLKIELWSEHAVRIVSTMNDEFEENSGMMANRSNEEVKFKVAYAQSDIEITTSHIFISISEKGLVRLFSRDGRKLIVESDRSFEPVEGDGAFYRVSQRFYLNRREHIYGLGQKNGERLYNLRDHSFDIVQNESSIAMPVFYSEKGYAFIWDNYSKTHFTDEPSGLTLSSEYEKEISYFFINGSDWNTLFSEIQLISGYPNLLPYSAYGLPLKIGVDEPDINDDFLSFGNDIFNHSLLEKEKELYQSSKENKHFQNIAAYLELKNDYRLALSGADGQRPAIITHINTPGIQQYSTVTTDGKLPGSWDALKSQVIAGISSSFSGQPHWSTNIGGASAPGNTEDANDLLTRWYQFAVFTPVMQIEPLTQNGYNIQEGSENFSAIENALRLRNMLLPYTYSTAAIAVRDKHAIIRSLLYDFREQDEVRELNTQYMFGSSMMVCPITKPGIEKLEVTLPEGISWYNFHTGEKLKGVKKLKHETTIDNIPVFVKAGSIIPLMAPDTINVYEVRVYPGADGEFVFYYDDKTSMNYENDVFTQIEFEYNDRRNHLTIGSAEGEFPGFPETVTFRVIMVKDGTGVGNNLSDEYETIIYDGSKEKVKF